MGVVWNSCNNLGKALSLVNMDIIGRLILFQQLTPFFVHVCLQYIITFDGIGANYDC